MTLAARLEILPPVQRQLWPSLRGLAAAGFVLYGGTAIALRCGQRVSVDFDFFTARPLERAALQRLLPWLESSTVLQDQPGTFTVLSAGDAVRQGGVKVSFFGGLTIGRVAEPEPSSDDVAVLLASGLTLTEGLGAARALYGSAFPVSEALKALVYFADGDLGELPASTQQPGSEPERATALSKDRRSTEKRSTHPRPEAPPPAQWSDAAARNVPGGFRSHRRGAPRPRAGGRR